MSAPETKAPEPLPTLARALYVELVARCGQAGGASFGTTVPAEALARASFQLAAAFLVVEEEIRTAGKPKANYQLDASSISDWMK